jgi:hypothetical protein
MLSKPRSTRSFKISFSSRSAISKSRTCSRSSTASCLAPTTLPTTQRGSLLSRGSSEDKLSSPPLFYIYAFRIQILLHNAHFLCPPTDVLRNRIKQYKTVSTNSFFLSLFRSLSSMQRPLQPATALILFDRWENLGRSCC